MARWVVTRLDRQHPNADTELQYSNAYELLVATILSAQSTDARVNLVTPPLFKRYPEAAVLARATPEELEPQIVSTGFFRMKSRALIAMAQALVARHDGQVPPRMEDLVELPGVGRKTANVVLGHALGVPGLPVDRHVLRVANRIGIARADNPEIVEQQLCTAVPRNLWTKTSDLLILHGRRICRPKPLCDRCPFAIIATSTGTLCMQRREFEKLVEAALETIPQDFRDAIVNMAIVVEDEPSPELLDEMGMEDATLMGLYQGTPLPERSSSHGNTLPDVVTLFQGPIEDEAEGDREQIIWEIGATLIHELGHYFGLSEDEIEEIEDRYWQGED